MFDRLAARVSYVQGDFGDPATYERVAQRSEREASGLLSRDAAVVFRACRRRPRRGRADQERARRVEKPFGHDSRRPGARRRAAPVGSGRADLPRRSFPRQARSGRAPLPAFREHDARACLEQRARLRASRSRWPRSFGVEDRGRFYDAVGALRDVVVNHLLQLLAAATMEAPRKTEILDEARHRLFKSIAEADPARYVRGQYAGYRATPGVAARSTTETYAALELRIDNERWRDVPVLHPRRQAPSDHPDRGPPHLPRRPAAHVPQGASSPRPTSSSSGSIPSTGLRHDPRSPSRRRGRPGADRPRMEFAEQGGEGPTPYEVLFQAALDRRPHALHPSGDDRGDVADRAAAARSPAAEPPLPPWQLGTGRSPQATEPHGGWRSPWKSRCDRAECGLRELPAHDRRACPPPAATTSCIAWDLANNRSTNRCSKPSRSTAACISAAPSWHRRRQTTGLQAL